MSNENIDDDLFEDIVEEGGSKIDIEVPDAGSVHDELLDQVKNAEGRALRAQAELENFRQRAKRELDDSLKFANQSLLADLLPVIDNVYRAISAASKDVGSDSLLEGVLMVAQQLLDTLRKHHCIRIEAIGEVFDPNRHEAIQQMPSDEIEAGNVLQVVQEGYLLHDRVVRPAQVIVSTGAAPA
jgi:molecular chaperone GrpE